MGNDDSPNILSALYESLSSHSANRSGITAFVQLCNSVRVTAQQASLASVANFFRNLPKNDSVNWGQVVFLTTCLVTMAGCGIFSSFRRRRSSTKKARSQRPTISKTSTKSSSKTLTSSDDDYEDDEYDSSGSLRHGTKPFVTAEERSSQPEQHSSDGESKDLRLRNSDHI